jgi:fatty acid desaturase
MEVHPRCRDIPGIPEVRQLKSSDVLASLHTGSCIALTALSLYLSASSNVFVWLLGQLLLALALLQWFVLLHECGHKTFFRSQGINIAIGHVASFFSVIPFYSWQRIHALHHRWTGWQDLDPTTETLVTRELSRFEQLLANMCWRFSIPLFAIVYRINNFWNWPRLMKFFRAPEIRRRIVINVVLLAAAYAVALWVIGPARALRLCGVALLVTLILQEWLILSQHTHVRHELSRGEKVRPFAALEQEPYTRSLVFPRWVARSLLINFNAHELHHMYPFVPAYHLHRIDCKTLNNFEWWHWLKTVKRLPGETFLFHNREETGLNI